jgi:hypothetical protein
VTFSPIAEVDGSDEGGGQPPVSESDGGPGAESDSEVDATGDADASAGKLDARELTDAQDAQTDATTVDAGLEDTGLEDGAAGDSEPGAED